MTGGPANEGYQLPFYLLQCIGANSRAVIDVGVAQREDLHEALGIMAEVGEQLRRDPMFAPRIPEPLEMVGVERWDESAVILRCRFMVEPVQQWNVRREYPKPLKNAFDAHDIEIPSPHLTLSAGAAKDGTAPTFRLRHETP
jgi:small conductance mechanosensitive channel